MVNSDSMLIKDFYQDEITYKEFYTRLSYRSKNNSFKDKLLFLASVEDTHSKFWKRRMERAGTSSEKIRPKKLRISMLLFLTRIIGKSLTINLLERGEVESIRKYRDYLEVIQETDEQEKLKKIIEDEISHESVFNEMSPDRDSYLDKIQAFIYGMSDGLVEVVAAMAGLTAIISNNFIIAMSGMVIGVGGTISMTLGAYLSKSSETEFRVGNMRRLNLLRNESETKLQGKIEKEQKRSSESALTTGISYISGAAFPIIPFLFPLGLMSLIIAVILVATVQAISNAIIAIALNISILKSALRASMLSLGAAAITYAIGFIFHFYFHIYIG